MSTTADEVMAMEKDAGMDTPELKAFYSNRKQMWRNIIFMQLGWWGHNICFTVVGPLMLLRMKEVGIQENSIGLVSAINSWAVSFLVMYFSWKSDHMVSRFGRRLPFLLISMPFIAVSVVLFPFFKTVPVLLALWLMQMFFMDMKMSTYPLLGIDLVPRHLLGRLNAVGTVIGGITGFLTLRYGMRLSELSYELTYIVCAAFLVVFTLAAVFGVKEPPIRHPTTETFKPWSALKIGWRDKRIIPLMIAVGSIHSFLIMFGNWLWLYAAHDLKLNRTDCGDALSWASLLAIVLAFPYGWLIDKAKGITLMIVLLVCQWLLFIVVWHTHNANWLLAASLLQTMFAPLYGAADLMVYRNWPANEVGSITSSLSFIRNMYAGCIVFVSGQLIVWGGTNYKWAFILGIAMSTLAMPLFYLHRYLMQPGRGRPAQGTGAGTPSAPQGAMAAAGNGG